MRWVPPHRPGGASAVAIQITSWKRSIGRADHPLGSCRAGRTQDVEPPAPLPTPNRARPPQVSELARKKATIRTDPAFSARIVVTGEITYLSNSATTEVEQTIDLAGGNLRATWSSTANGAKATDQSETVYMGTVYLRSGDGPWIQDEQSLTSPLPTFASAFDSVTGTTRLGPVACAGRTYEGLRAEGLNLTRFMATLGMVDPLVPEGTGSIHFCVKPSGLLAGFEIDWQGSISSDDPSLRVSQTMSAVVSAKTLSAVTAPDPFWKRTSQTKPAFHGIYPATWESYVPTISTAAQPIVCYGTHGHGNYICVSEKSTKLATKAALANLKSNVTKNGATLLIEEPITLVGFSTYLWTFVFEDSSGLWAIHMTGILRNGRLTFAWSNDPMEEVGSARDRFIDFLSEFNPA
jgi:hypothetical protein